MSICYGLRLTPCEIDASANPQDFLHLFKDLIRTYDLKDYALGHEKLNKFGEPTKPHFHFNFLCDANKQAIQTHIRRWYMYKIKGKTMYALTRYPEPDNFNRWFRYVAKEKLLRKLCNGFTDAEFDEMELLAKDERKRSIKFNIEKRELCMQKQTLYDKYAKKIDEDKNLIPTYKNIWLKFLELYTIDKKVINTLSIKGYTHLYMLTRKHITPLKFYQLSNP